MKYDEFVKLLKKNLPDLKQLKKLDYSKEEITDIENSYILKATKNNKNLYPELGEIGELISRYQIDKLEVGMISFLNEPIKKHDEIIIGNVESDELVFSCKDSLILVKEGSTVLWECASGSENFLKAILNMMKYFSSVTIDESLYDNNSVLEKYSHESAELAGGERFLHFYQMLLGI